MIRIAVICLLFLQVLTLEPPEKCKRPPMHNGKNPFKCCNMPPFFIEEDFKACGIEKPDGDGEGTKPKPLDCDKQICLMKRYNLMKDESTVDRAAISAFLDKWAETNEDFKDAVEVVKTKCINGELMGPPGICDTVKMNFCVITTIFHNCPKWDITDDCAEVKDFIQECAPK